jgi:N-acetylglucosaminyldiphosphoundecaprenol N-acetyl-beta-D-mannosaminyltransferase
MEEAPQRLRLGHVEVDAVTSGEALDAIEALVAAGRGGLVVTPNVHHVVIAERSPEFRAAYASADLSLADGVPIVLASRLLGPRLPEKISGSDLLGPLLERAGARGWRVYFLGAAPGIAEEAARRARERWGVAVAGVDAPFFGGPDDAEARAAAARVGKARAHLLLLAFGAPKQETFAHRYRAALGPAVAMGVGVSFDYLAGRDRRAPPWVSRNGLEWLWRLVREPRRLWRRYLVEDPVFLAVLWRAWRARRALA